MRTAAAAHGALEILLTDAAVGGRRRFVPAGAAARTAAGLARRPRRPAARAKALGAELARVAAGRSQLRPLADGNALLVVPEGVDAAEPPLTYEAIVFEPLLLTGR